MNILSDIAKFEKNKMYTDGVFVMLLEINIPNYDTIRLCYNNEDLTWNGVLWQTFPLEIGESSQEQDGSIPNIEIKVCNITRELQGFVEDTNGANKGKITVYVVNSKNLTSTTPELEEKYAIQKAHSDQEWITFTVGPDYSPNSKMPQERYLKNCCRYCYKSVRCGYSGDLTACNHTLTDCRKHSNSKRYGGFPGIDQGGIYK